MRPLLAQLFALFVCLGSGCGTSENDAPSPGDMGMSRVDVSTPDEDMGTAPNGTTVGAFEPGWNVVSENTPDSVTLLDDGEEIPFVFGVQGSWMVVLAFRTRDLFEEPFDIQAEITLDGVDAGDIWLADQETFPGGDGWNYYYNLFLPIDDQPPERGTPVGIVMRILTADGETIAEEEFAMLAGPADGP